MLLFFVGCASFLGTDIAPEIQMTVPNSGYSDIEIEMSAVITDNHDLPSELILLWHSDIDGDIDFSSDTEGHLSFFGLLSEGNHKISLSAEDLDGNITTVSDELIIGPDNVAPSCNFIPSEEFWVENTPIALEAEASDPNIPPEELIVEWFSEEDGALGMGEIDETGKITFTADNLSWNEHTITVLVTDEVGATCESSAIVRVGHVPNIEYCTDVLNWSEEWKTFEQEVVTLTNEIRAEGTTCDGEAFPSVPPVTMQRNLRCSSRVHSKDMVDRDYFDHTNPSGESPGDRISLAAYSWSTYGENIAYGYSSPQEVVDGWHQSPGHCRNMMSDWFDEIGVGVYQNGGSLYWTQNFGSR